MYVLALCKYTQTPPTFQPQSLNTSLFLSLCLSFNPSFWCSRFPQQHQRWSDKTAHLVLMESHLQFWQKNCIDIFTPYRLIPLIHCVCFSDHSTASVLAETWKAAQQHLRREFAHTCELAAHFKGRGGATMSEVKTWFSSHTQTRTQTLILAITYTCTYAHTFSSRRELNSASKVSRTCWLYEPPNADRHSLSERERERARERETERQRQRERDKERGRESERERERVC